MPFFKIGGVIGADYPITVEHTGEKAAIYGLFQIYSDLHVNNNCFPEKKITGVSYSKYRSSLVDEYPPKIFRQSPFFVSDGKSKVYVKPYDNQPELEVISLHEEAAGNLLVSLLLSPWIRYP
jgi:hypothetical protein